MPAFTDRIRLACALVFAVPALAYEDGAPAATSGGFDEADCSACHSDNRVNDRRGNLRLDGLPAAFRPGADYELAIILSHPALEAAGLQMTIRRPDGRNAGRFEAAADSGLAVQHSGGVDYLQHVEPGRPEADATAVRWTVRWQAPDEAAALRLDLAANAANGDASALGDYVYRLGRDIDAVRSSSPAPAQAGSDRSGRSAPAQESGSAPAARSSNRE